MRWICWLSRADGPRPRGSNYHGVMTQPSLEARSFYGRGKRNANNSVAGPCVLRLRVSSITLYEFACSAALADFAVIERLLTSLLVIVSCYSFDDDGTRNTNRQHGYLAYGTSSCRRVSPVRRDTRADGSIAPCPLTALCIVWSQCGDCRGLCGLVYVHRTRESSQPIL